MLISNNFYCSLHPKSTSTGGSTRVQRTVVFIRFNSQVGEYLFIKGGISTTQRPECSGATSAATSPCAIPILVSLIINFDFFFTAQSHTIFLLKNR